MPPNLLVGQGATDFAHEQGIPIVRYESLVSPAAQERWRRWSQDLIAAERKEREAQTARYGASPTPSDADYNSQYLTMTAEKKRKLYTTSMAEALVNDAQPVSPPASDDRKSFAYSSSPSRASSAISIPQAYSTDKTTPEADDSYTDPYGPPGPMSRPSVAEFVNSPQTAAETIPSDTGKTYGNKDGGFSRYGAEEQGVRNSSEIFDGVSLKEYSQASGLGTWSDGTFGTESTTASSYHGIAFEDIPQLGPAPRSVSSLPGVDQDAPTPRATSPDEAFFSDKENSLPPPTDEDSITDTVGAIAIDMYGNIACGASSGGIGMKHRGRIGPAALVGIGASVIPVDPDDPDRTTVATVTSGTGEHMGTTMAASVCSNRIFYSQRRTPGGGTEQVTEDEALKAFIERDFMNHPSVRHSQSTGAIGMLTVKRTSDGAWLYYAHNTDSFAIASMSSDDAKPSCSMSRSRGNGTIAQGGKGVRFRRKK